VVFVVTVALSVEGLTSESTSIDSVFSCVNASLTATPSANAAATAKCICETLLFPWWLLMALRVNGADGRSVGVLIHNEAEKILIPLRFS